MKWICVDGNEAAARVAYACSEVVTVYPITPKGALDRDPRPVDLR